MKMITKPAEMHIEAPCVGYVTYIVQEQYKSCPKMTVLPFMFFS